MIDPNTLSLDVIRARTAENLEAARVKQLADGTNTEAAKVRRANSTTLTKQESHIAACAAIVASVARDLGVEPAYARGMFRESRNTAHAMAAPAWFALELAARDTVESSIVIAHGLSWANVAAAHEARLALAVIGDLPKPGVDDVFPDARPQLVQCKPEPFNAIDTWLEPLLAAAGIAYAHDPRAPSSEGPIEANQRISKLKDKRAYHPTSVAENESIGARELKLVIEQFKAERAANIDSKIAGSTALRRELVTALDQELFAMAPGLERWWVRALRAVVAGERYFEIATILSAFDGLRIRKPLELVAAAVVAHVE